MDGHGSHTPDVINKGLRLGKCLEPILNGERGEQLENPK